MPFKDVLLFVDTYPDALAPDVMDQATALCARLGRTVTAVAHEVRLDVRSNQVAEMLIGLSDLAKAEERRCHANAATLLARFKTRAAEAELAAEAKTFRASPENAAECLAHIARTHDICVIPHATYDGVSKSTAEQVVFASGRPVLTFTPNPESSPAGPLAKIVIAWDASRPAARAVADAMPILAGAAEVRVLTILNEKPSATAGVADELVRHLARHRIHAHVDAVEADGDPIGTVLDRYLVTTEPDLLVMGAFGHSRTREFILGGATRSVLHAPRVPVLLSH